MRLADPRIDTDALLALIRAEYSLDTVRMRFHPVGEDSSGYVLDTASRGRYFVKVREKLRWGVPAERLDAVRGLAEGCRMEFVVAAVPAMDGRLQIDFGPFSVDLYPYLEGGYYFNAGEPPPDPQRLGGLMARLHSAAGCVAAEGLGRERFDAPYRGLLLDVLRAAGGTPGSGAAADAAALIRDHAAAILRVLAAHEALGSLLEAERLPFVPTHGDAHWANFMQENGEPRLIDWDGALLAPPERDLLFFSGETFPEFLDGYRAGLAGPVALDRRIFYFYMWRWTLGEIADFGSRLLLEHLPELEQQHALSELRQYFPLAEMEIQAAAERIAGLAGADG